MHKLAQSVLADIRKNDLLRAGDRVGIAVSGGADSVALLRLVLELRDELGIVISIVHLNHKLRGADSDADEQFVGKLAEAHGLEIISESCDVKALAAGKKLSLEAAAREARYEFFARAFQFGVNRIATAHTLDDQAETVLLKLSRGAGTRGLAGIYPKRAVVGRRSSVVGNSKIDALASQESQKWIVRPLLETRRIQLRSYLVEIGQSWREDASNQDLRHTRNRIRHEILPLLEREVKPSVCKVLAEAAEIARAEEEYWAEEVNRLLLQVWRGDQQGGILTFGSINPFPRPLRRRLVRAAAETLALALEFRHVEEILGLSADGNRASLPRGWMAMLEGDGLRFRNAPEEAHGYEYQLQVPGKIKAPEAAVEIQALLVTGINEGATDDLVDSKLAGGGFVVRNWRAGERFWPAHTKEPKKIKELLQDRHITGERKRLWPVVASGDEIVWVRGFGVRRDFQAKNGTGILIQELTGSQK